MTEHLTFPECKRVVIDEDGGAVSPLKAWEMFGVMPEILFRRDDGWVLGAPSEYERVCFRLWEHEWTEFFRRGDRAWRPISEYRPGE